MRIIQLMLIILLLSPFVPPVDDGGVLAHFTPPDSLGGVGAKIASEEENIDSFDVSPASGRWNVTSDDLTDDLVTDSILRMTTINNETSDSSGFAMDRGMSKSDGKVEYRMSASGGGNQTEYYREFIGDKCDFDEGDTEGWIGVNTGTISVDNGIATIDAGIGSAFAGIETDPARYNLNIVFNTIELKLKSAATTYDLFLTFFAFDDSVSQQSTITANEEWEIYTVSFNSNIKNITEFSIVKANVAAAKIFMIDYIKFTGNLDYATFVEGEIEDTWDWEEENSTEGWDFLENMNVTNGFFNGTMAAAADDVFLSPASLSMDTNLFTILKMKIKAENSTSIKMDVRGTVDTGTEFFGSRVTINSTFDIFTLDLSSDSDWAGTLTRVRFDFVPFGGGNFDGTESILLDYILFLGHWADSDSVIGLWDQDDLVPLLNVSSHFTSNNSHPTTSDKAYFTVELLDLDGEVSYSAISDNYTDVSDSWIQGKIQYDILRSKLIVTINWDNLTRIEKWTFPKDFTVVSGRIPALFSHSKSPSIFTSTFCQPISWQEMKLGYIKADFKERRWIQIHEPTDANYLNDGPFICRAQDNISTNSTWRLTVPYLDAVSGVMSSNFTNYVAPGVVQDQGIIAFSVYGVDADDGELHLLITAQITLGFHPISTNPYLFWIFGSRYEQQEVTANPRMSFSIAILEERSEIMASARVWEDISVENDFRDLVENTTIANIVDEPSQEFVLETIYFVDFDRDAEFTALFEDFGFTEKDIFSDIANAIVEPLGNFFQQIFVGLFRFTAGIFRIVGDAITLSIFIMQTATTAAIAGVTSALGTLQAALIPAIEAVTTAVGNVETAIAAIGTAIGLLAADIASEVWDGVGTALDFITDAIADIAENIWIAFGLAAAQVMDDIITALTGLAQDVAIFIEAMIVWLIPLLLALASEISGFIVGIIDELLTIGGDILAGIINFLAGVIFFIWDALGLPDILAVFALFITPIVEIVTGLPVYVTEIGDLIAIFFIVILGIYWFWLIFLAFAEKGFDIFAGFGESVSRLFTFWNLSILGFGPIPIPIALFFIPLTYFFIVPSGSVFAIW